MKKLLLIITIFVCNISLYANTQTVNSHINRPEHLKAYLESLSKEIPYEELFAILTR